MKKIIPVEYWQYGLKDVIDGFSAIARFSREEQILDIPGIGQCLATRSARVALAAVLSAMELKHGCNVAVPLYCCPVVFKVVEECGFRPCFIDVEMESGCMAEDDLKKKQGNYDAVIAVHMFGNVCDVEALRKASGGEPIVEDCAQSLGSTYASSSVGKNGIASVYSFRAGKYISAGEGGALYTEDQELLVRSKQFIETLNEINVLGELKHVLKTYIRAKLRDGILYELLGRRLWSYYGRKVDFQDQAPVIYSKAYITDICLARRRLKNLEHYVNCQKSISSEYEKRIPFGSKDLRTQKVSAIANGLRFPILASSEAHADRIEKVLRNKKIDCNRPYRSIASIAQKLYNYRGGCQNSEEIARRLIVIPNHHALSPDEVNRVCNIVSDAISS
jgi:perosamine synthetase